MSNDPIAKLEEIATAPIRQTKRKYRRRAPGKLRIAEPKVEAEFPGLTVFNCCDTCGPNCIITEAGSGICAHPAKAGLQAADMVRPAVLAKFNRAKKELAKQQLEKKMA